MKIEFDSSDKPETLRAAAAVALMLAGDIPLPALSTDDEVPAGTVTAPVVLRANVVPFPSAPSAPSMPSAAPMASSPGTASSPPTVGAPPVMPLLPATSAPLPPSQPPQQNFSAPQFATAPSVAPVATTVAPSAGSAAFATPVSAPSFTVPAPPPMNPPVVTTAGPAPASNPPAAVEYDKSGLPWDARIHNKGRTKKADGTWKLQRGIDPVFAQSVVAELAAKKQAVLTASAPTSGALQPGMTVVGPGVPPGSTLTAPIAPLPPTGGPLTPENEARVAFGQPPVFNALPPGWTRDANGQPVPPAGQQFLFGMPGPNTVPLPPAASAVPLPPQSNGAAPQMVPPQTATAPVPPHMPPAVGVQQPAQYAPAPDVPGVPSAGSGPVAGSPTPPPGATPYRLLMDRLTAAVGAKQLDPRKIAPVVQHYGAPNFNELGNPQFASLIPLVESDFNKLIAGLPLDYAV